MQNFLSFKISAKVHETTEACTFELESESGQSLHYESGQFLTLVFETAFGEKRRSYSFSSSPFEHKVCITVKKVDNGEFSRALIDRYQVGDSVFSAGVGGQFTLHAAEQAEQVFFLAAGSGITPCFAMIKELLQTTSKQVVLYYSNKSKRDIIFYDALEALRSKYAQRFQIRYFNSDAELFSERRLSHFLLPQLLQADVRVLDAKVMCYLCGPFEYMQMAEIALRSRFEPNQIRKEQFDSRERTWSPKPPDTEKHPVHLNWQGEERVLEAGYPQSILQSALKAGIVLPYSCSAGRCGACIATCVKGKVWMAYNEVLTDKEVENGRFLTCQAYPQEGEIWVEIE